MGFRDLERRIERGVDGVLGKVFNADVSRGEVAKRVERELDAGARKSDDGGRIMPNDIEVRLHPDDVRHLDASTGELERDLLTMARTHAKDVECAFVGPLVVVVTETDDAQKGTIEVFATTHTSIEGTPPGTLVYPDGYRYDLTGVDRPTSESGITLGRDVASSIVIDDDLASRHHARIRPTTRGWVIEDLGSTNGTRVNGFRSSVQLLTDGDHVTVGATTFLFDAS